MEPGRILADRYEILRPLAEGASSTVWEARDAEGGGIVAVKAVSLEQAGWRAEVRDRFEKEGRLLQLVRHEHLVGVRDRGETDDGFLFLILDRLRGETLADRLARPPRLSWREAATVALDLARGLAALHARGIVHRDLKPANVILDDAGDGSEPVCKIIDLGISKASALAADPLLFATLTATGQVLGTPEYMSHEQALGERDVDARADVWAVGAILYEMIAGRRPFVGSNPNAVLAAIRKGAPPPLGEAAPGTPAAIAEVVARALSRARDDRPRDGEALSEALADAIRRAEAADTMRGRARWLAIAAAAAIVAGGIVLASRGTPGAQAEGRGSGARPIDARTAGDAESVGSGTAAPAAATGTTDAASTPASAGALGSAGSAGSGVPAPGASGSAGGAPPRAPRAVTRVNSAGF